MRSFSWITALLMAGVVFSLQPVRVLAHDQTASLTAAETDDDDGEEEEDAGGW